MCYRKSGRRAVGKWIGLSEVELGPLGNDRSAKIDSYEYIVVCVEFTIFTRRTGEQKCVSYTMNRMACNTS